MKHEIFNAEEDEVIDAPGRVKGKILTVDEENYDDTHPRVVFFDLPSKTLQNNTFNEIFEGMKNENKVE